MNVTKYLVLFLTISSLLWMHAVASPTRVEYSKLLASDGNNPDQFGHDIAVFGNTAIISSYFDNTRGAVYAFQKDSMGVWQQEDKFTASGLSNNAGFGQSLSLYERTAVVGAFQQNSLAGAAYVFSSDSNGNWTQISQLNPLEATSRFGNSSAIWDDTIIVGTAFSLPPLASTPGAAYVFSKDGSGWQRSAKLTANDGQANDNFGWSVSLYGNRALVGAPFDDDLGSVSGSAYIFEHNGSSWQQVAKLNASDGSESSIFGHAVSLWDNFALIGAPGAGNGAAYLFHTDGNGNWNQIAKITPDDNAVNFGRSIALNGYNAVVAVRDVTSVGSAYLFQFDENGNWNEQAKLLPSDGVNGQIFGSSVALSGSDIFVGSEGDNQIGEIAGSAYVFRAIPEPTSTVLLCCLATLSTATHRGRLRVLN